MKSTPSPARIAAFAFALIAVGFVLGIGYQTLQYANLRSGKTSAGNTSGNGKNSGSNSGAAKNHAPIVRGLRISPNDRLLAFNVLYGTESNQTQQASRFVFDLKTYHWSEAKSPTGWQDSITQWSEDGKKILFTREKIPRTKGEGEPGLYEEEIELPSNKTAGDSEKNQRRSTPQALSEGAEPSGEKAYAGFWTPDGKLVMKTRRESKALYLKKNDTAQIVDRSPGTYYQNRAVMENGVLAYYVVRDISVEDGPVGLFRISEGKTRQVGSTLSDVVWVYIAENARWMIVCHYAENGRDWQWSLYQVSPTQSILAREATIPEDVIAVYWSPDFKQILGAAGKSLWLIEVPSLKTRKLGERDDWNADDAAWLSKQNAAVVASGGHLWKVDMASGKRTEVWKFPKQYWY